MGPTPAGAARGAFSACRATRGGAPRAGRGGPALRRSELIRDPRFADNPARREHDEELTAELEECFATHTADGLIALLDGAGIANARLRDIAEFAAHPQLEARARWREFDSPVGPL